MVLPLFNQYLKDGPAANLPSAAIYNTGENHWDKLTQWPLACQTGCAAPLTPLYLADDEGLSFDKPAAGQDSYVSDPANPVPHLSRPVNFSDGRWGDWLVSDQRHADGRTDVVTYRSPVLTKAVRVSGAPIADLFARTTGTDGDFVVKIIDVYPSEDAIEPKMGGYELPISLDIFRGRYRNSFANPTAIPAGKVQEYKFRLPTVNHVFQPGHRIMIQSSRACSRSTTAIPRPSCPISSRRRPAITKRRRSRWSAAAPMPAACGCQWCRSTSRRSSPAECSRGPGGRQRRSTRSRAPSDCGSS